MAPSVCQDRHLSSRRHPPHPRPLLTSPFQIQLTSKHTSQRYSIYSGTPSFAYSERSNDCSQLDTAMAEIKHVTQGLDRLENKHLQQQRFVPSQKKTDDLSQLALAAKIQRAVDRRMTNQDATYKSTKSIHAVLNEKPRLESKRTSATC